MSRSLSDERIRTLAFGETILYRHFKSKKVKNPFEVAAEARRILDIGLSGVEEEGPIDAVLNVVATTAHNLAVKKMSQALGLGYDALQEVLYELYEGGPKVGRERFFERVAEMEAKMELDKSEGTSESDAELE